MFKYTKKIISLVLIVSFILTSAIPSYGFNGRTLFTHKSHAQRHISSSEEYKDIIKTPSLLDIPNELGRIIEYHKGKSNSLVVHIQDRHIDPLTQNNIAEIIKRVNQAHSIHLVCLEGAAQELDTSFYDSFDNTPSKQRVAEFFLQKGIFTGPEFFKITNKDTYIRAVGVENEELYLRHLASYRKNELDKDSVIELLRSMKSALEKTKRILYSKELKELDSINTSYKYQQLNLTEYLLKLKQYADKAGIDTAQYRDLSQFIKLVEKEKSTNFGKAETEREALIKDLSDSLDTQQTRELLQMSLDFRVNKISDIAFYNYLESLIVNYALPAERYENLLHYVEYIEFSKTFV